MCFDGTVVVMCWQAAPSIGLVGKGIVYDTGGLNLKSTGGRGMKGKRATQSDGDCTLGQSHTLTRTLFCPQATWPALPQRLARLPSGLGFLLLTQRLLSQVSVSFY
jgi:hypothetical protein